MTEGKITLKVGGVELVMDGVEAYLTVRSFSGNEKVTVSLGKREGILLGEFLADNLHWWRV